MNFDRKTIIDLSIAEIERPSLGVTEQVIENHKVLKEPLRIDANAEPGAYYVYFKIIDEAYYFVIVLRASNGVLEPSASYIEAKARVYLRIDSDSITPEEISNRLALAPTHSARIGDRRANRPSAPVYKQHYWKFEPLQDIPESFELKLANLLNTLEPCSEALKSLSSAASLTINVCYEGYAHWMGGIHIEHSQMQHISAIGAELDIDLYASGPELGE